MPTDPFHGQVPHVHDAQGNCLVSSVSRSWHQGLDEVPLDFVHELIAPDGPEDAVVLRLSELNRRKVEAYVDRQVPPWCGWFLNVSRLPAADYTGYVGKELLDRVLAEAVTVYGPGLS